MTGDEATAWDPEERGLFRSRYVGWGRGWALAGVASVLVGVGLAQVVEPVAGILVATLGGTLGLILGFAFWFTGRGAQAQLDALRGGAYLARWWVDRDRWMAWYEERQRAATRIGWLLIGTLVLCGLVAAGLIYRYGDRADGGWIALVVLASTPVMWAVLRAHRAPPPRASLRGVPLIIGPRGALTVGDYLQWWGFGLAFEGAWVESEPPTLSVRYQISTKHGQRSHTLLLPVPPDRLDEARAVAERLTASGGR